VERDLAAAVDLPQARDAGDDVEALAVLERVLLHLLRHGRARTDEAHVADEDVPQLRQLVDAGAADEPADRRDARVVLHLEDDAVLRLVLREQLGLARLGVLVHAAELVELEMAAVAPDADLAEDDGAGARQPDGRRDAEKDGRQENESEAAADDVHQPLDRVGRDDGGAPRHQPEAAAAVAP